MINCRICRGRDFTKFLDLGFTPPADQFLSYRQLQEPEVHYPLEVVMCNGCGFVQLTYVVPPDVLYQRDYPYEASITRTGQLHWAEFAERAVQRMSLSSQSLVVDIGSNVGVLLQAFKNQGMRTLGVEPAANIAGIARREGIETIDEFFSMDVARQIVETRGRAAVITATNVFAHVDDLHSFMKAIDALLADNGAFIIEAPYLVNLIERLEYDTIYHEHLSYLSLKPLKQFFEQLNMEVFDVEQRDIHGGSFRIYLSRRGAMPISPVIGQLLQLEEEKKLYAPETLKQFSCNVQRNRRELVWLLQGLKHEGKRIAAVSAPAKGMTLLNYCRLGRELLDFATEKSTLKIGRFTPGMHIPVVADEELLKRTPDYALLLAWNFADEIMNNLSEYRQRGGKFIIPIPEPRIVV